MPVRPLQRRDWMPRRWRAAAASALCVVAGCGDRSAPAPGPVPGPASRAAAPVTGVDDVPWFVEIAATSGLDFRHTTGSSGQFFFPEISASGGALLDYDGDGDLDVYAIQAYPLDRPGTTDARNRLYRNDLVDGVPRFVDVTDAAGVGDDGYGMGCATGDIDNDGDVDLFVTNVGANMLYRNAGDGTFAADPDAVPRDERWNTSASFADYDGDGDLDLFVAAYVNYSLAEHKACHSPSGRRDYCGPASYQPVPDRLYRNRGDGTFEDVTTAAGIDAVAGSGLGVVAADFDGDGRVDFYVANDGNANHLWMNRGDGTFRNEALYAGAAYNAEGMAEAGMGVSAGDFDGDDDEDLFLSHLVGETNTLLVNDGRAGFDDASDRSGLGASSRRATGFGTRWVDVDGDGWPDLFVANGAVRLDEDAPPGDAYPYGQMNQLFRNEGPPGWVFTEVTNRMDAGSRRVESSRGAAFGDIDLDGDPDIVVFNGNAPVRLMRNDVGNGAHWLRLRLRGTAGARDAFGAIVRLRDATSPRRERVSTDGSYCSANDPTVRFGLGSDDRAREIEVTWPGGRVERFGPLAPDVTHEIVEGMGTTP
ncbi:MAG: CRTAC1 family protein [Phycisphaerales bacterium]|nr:CRTAC1 family protein [Phycisphaerales bacterium]